MNTDLRLIVRGYLRSGGNAYVEKKCVLFNVRNTRVHFIFVVIEYQTKMK